MSIYVDSSVLVRAVVTKHKEHQPAWDWFNEAAARTQLVACTHALAETFNHVSGRYQTPFAECRKIIGSLKSTLMLVSLSQADYFAAIDLGWRRKPLAPRSTMRFT